MKKIISILVVIALTAVFLMSSAFAAEDPQIVVSSVEAVGGDEIKLTVSLVNNPGFTNGKITVTYDETGLEFVKIDTATQDAFANGIQAMSNGAVMNFVAIADVTVDVELFYIYLKVKDNAAGDYKVGLTVNLMKNNAEENVVFEVVEGVVTVNHEGVTGGDPEAPTTAPSQRPTDPEQHPSEQHPSDQPPSDHPPSDVGDSIFTAVAVGLIGVMGIVALTVKKKAR